MGLLMTSAPAGALGAPRPSFSRRSVTVIAHRGASAAAPENTLPAIALAAEMSADLVEVDVQMTRDGELVVIHDTTLRRTTDASVRFPRQGPWNVADFTLDQIRSLDAGSWFDTRFAGIVVPTLAEVLDTLWGRAGLLLEIKAPALYPRIASTVAAELDRRGWLDAPPQPLVVQSFDWDVMRAFNRLAPQVTVGLLGGAPSLRQLSGVSAWADQLNTHHRLTSARLVHRVHASGMATWPYTVDDPHRMRSLIESGVDGIISNRPDLLAALLSPGATPQAA